MKWIWKYMSLFNKIYSMRIVNKLIDSLLPFLITMATLTFLPSKKSCSFLFFSFLIFCEAANRLASDIHLSFCHNSTWQNIIIIIIYIFSKKEERKKRSLFDSQPWLRNNNIEYRLQKCLLLNHECCQGCHNKTAFFSRDAK